MKEHIELSKKCLKEKLLRIKQVQQITGLSKSYIYQLCSQTNQFPKSIQLIAGGSSVAWVESEILQWIDSRIKARDEGEV
jgi:prophage regulatory protein